jgi:hypothetical protein
MVTLESDLHAKVREFTAKGRAAIEPDEKEFLLGLARSYLLLAKNAAWLASTDDFLKAVNKGMPWPRANPGHPTVDSAPL